MPFAKPLDRRVRRCETREFRMAVAGTGCQKLSPSPAGRRMPGFRPRWSYDSSSLSDTMNNRARTSFITAGGPRLHRRRIEARRGIPTLILLHEGLGTIAVWGDVPDAL